MYEKLVKWLTIGDQLAENIYDGETLLLKKGTLLTLNQILQIHHLGLQSVLVAEAPSPSDNHSYDGCISHAFPDNDNYFLEKTFNEFIFSPQLKGRYFNSIETADDFYYIKDFFISLLSNHIVANLLSALKIWDEYSYKHSIDVFIIGTQWLRKLGVTEQLKEVSTGFLLHDIGKVKIPREILKKSEKLTRYEYEIVKTHVLFGEQVLNKLGFSNMIVDLAMYHHKTLDGTGYPEQNLFNFHPPQEVKMLTIVDIFSALTLDRPYRKAFTTDEAIKIMKKERVKFDPELLEKFIQYISDKHELVNGVVK